MRGVLGQFKNAYNQYAQGKINKAFEDYMNMLRDRVQRLDNEVDRRATWEYVTRPESIVEIQRMLETSVRASEQEKIDAALNIGVNHVLNKGTDNVGVREFTAAFIRDCTGMDIRVLKLLPEHGTHNMKGEASDMKIEDIRATILDQIKPQDEAELELIRASFGKLYNVGICSGFANYGGGINPVQRSALGEEVFRRVTLIAEEK